MNEPLLDDLALIAAWKLRGGPTPKEPIPDVNRCCLDAIEVIKHAEVRHKLLQLHHADARELWKALEDLSFSCFGGIGVKAPSTEVYNATFAVLQKHRQGYSAVARSNPAGQQAVASGAWTCKRCGFLGFWSDGPHCGPGGLNER